MAARFPMIRTSRLKKVHAKFLASCRNLSEGRSYWDGSGPVARWLAQLVTPVPLMALHEEGKPVYQALLWLEENCGKAPLDEALVRHYHRLVHPKSPEPPGEYRRGPILIERSAHPCPPPGKVALLMRQFGTKLQDEQRRLDGRSPVPASEVLQTAVDFHHRLVAIHPFADANGRVARLLMNHVMRRYGQGYVVLPPLSESPEHFEALEAANGGDLSRLVRFAERFRMRV
jgi:Fic family protein